MLPPLLQSRRRPPRAPPRHRRRKAAHLHPARESSYDIRRENAVDLSGPVRRVRRAGLLDARYSRSPHQGLVRRLPDRSRRARGRAPRSERCASSAPMTDESLAKLAKKLRFGHFLLGHETLPQEDIEALFERNSVGDMQSVGWGM